MATILVADDDPVIQRLLSFILEQDGHEVVLAEDGMEAIARVEDTAVDLLLLDVNMPRLNGLDVLRRVRGSEGRDSLPVVILTASGQDRDADVAAELGVTQFMTKPFSSRALRSTLNRLLP